MSDVQPKPIGDVIKSVIGELDKNKREKETRILTAWENLVDKKVARHTKPVSLRGNRLVINVDESSWLYELNLRKENLLRKLQDIVGKENLNKLQFRIGEV